MTDEYVAWQQSEPTALGIMPALIPTGPAPAVGWDPDDHIYVNVGAGGVSDPLSINYITPPALPVTSPPITPPAKSLGIYDASGAQSNVGLILYEKYIPGTSPQYTRLVINANPAGPNFVISTEWTTTGGRVTGLSICPQGDVQIGNSPNWIFRANTGNIIPSQHISANIGQVDQAPNAVFTANLSIVQYNPAIVLFYMERDAAGNGAAMLWNKCIGAPNAPGTLDQLKIYVTSGTTPGTLKLACRGGNNGAVTTIVDNIPQS